MPSVQTSLPATLAKALALIDQGLPCFPCDAHKRPTTPHGFKNATDNANAAYDLWHQHPGELIGVPTGEASGLNVLDIDARHGGGSWYAEQQCQLPSTRVHRSRSGGLHLFFQHQPELRCSVSRIAGGVDIRATGGYIIWWPAAGLPVLSERPCAPWPRWLVAQLTPRPPAARPRMIVPDAVALRRLVRLVAQARPGERNSLTFWAACRAGEMVSSGLLRADAAADVIAEAAAHAGLPYAEAKRTAWSGLRKSGGIAHA